MPIDYSKYPANWLTEIRPAILKRAANRCEQCGVDNHAIGYRDENGHFVEVPRGYLCELVEEDIREMGFKIIRIILTVAHLDHDITNNQTDNLAALCQRCHNRHDVSFRKHNRKVNREVKQGLLTLF